MRHVFGQRMEPQIEVANSQDDGDEKNNRHDEQDVGLARAGNKNR